MPLKSKILKHQIFLERYAATVARKMQQAIDSARDEVLRELGTTDVNNINLITLKNRILKKLIKGVRASLKDIKELSVYERDFIYNALVAEAGDDIKKATLLAINQSILNIPMPIGTADDKQNKKMTTVYKQFVNQTANSMLQPIKDEQALGADVLTASAAIIALSGGLFKSQSDSIARTNVGFTSEVVREETFKKNKAIITHIRIVATLDSRTTNFCRSVNGKVFEIGKGIRPKFHYNCRTVTEPVIP